jgi:coniferyl-aldehyde dehydrogenase
MSAAISTMFPTLLNNADYTSLVTKRHYERLISYLDDARAKGGDVIEVNPGKEEFSSQPYNKLPPTLILNTTNDMRVMQEELFGPVLPIVGYNDIDEAIDMINSKPKPLAAYYFGDDNPSRKQFLEHTHSGGAVINDVVLHATVEDLPFGGVGESGMGSYHGRSGFETFSHARGVVRAPRFSPNLLMMPPYHRLQKLFSWMLRREVRKVDKRIRVYDARSKNK